MKLLFDHMARAAALGGLVLAAGCTHMLTPLGDNKYDCNRKEDPTSPYCHSFRSVESATNGPIPDSRYDQAMRLADHDRLTGIAPVPSPTSAPASAPSSEEKGPFRTAPSGIVAAPAALGETPVRIGPLVQRVWVKRHVDRNDMLIANTVLYKEIVPSHWAGFEAMARADTPGNRPVVAAYPHRAPSNSPSLQTPAKTTSSGANAAGNKPTEFVQPGTKAPEPADVAPVPATESGTPSMPQ